MPSRTEDFGDWWEPAPSLGLKVGISGQGCAIDSQDGDRILVMYSAASRRILAGWNAQAGIYLSKDGGDSFTLVQQLDDLSGSASETGLALHAVPLRRGSGRHARDAQVVCLPAPAAEGRFRARRQPVEVDGRRPELGDDRREADRRRSSASGSMPCAGRRTATSTSAPRRGCSARPTRAGAGRSSRACPRATCSRST